MNAWRLPGGDRLVLAHYNPETWAEISRRQLIAVGVSTDYANAYAERVRQATPYI